MKNLFGVVPGSVYGWPKNILHWAGIDESIVDMQSLFPKQFALVDGIEAMEGNGPILGTSKHMGLIAAGTHPPSVDATCCQIMGINPEKIPLFDFDRRENPAGTGRISGNPAKPLPPCNRLLPCIRTCATYAWRAVK